MATKKNIKKRQKKELRFVVVSNKGYGNRLKGQKIFFEGNQPPKGLREDGAFKFGKNILEILEDKFRKKFQLILTKDTDQVLKSNGINIVKISAKTLSKMNGEQFNRTRDIKLDILGKQFSVTHPLLVSKKGLNVYVSGRLSGILSKDIISKLSAGDRDALDKFIPDYLSMNPSAALATINAKAQLKTLKQFAKELRVEIPKGRSESWWQNYIKANILILQQGYIKAINNFNVSIGGTKYPDFLLVTHDSYLDVLEIKKPDTKLLVHDDSRDNYFFDKEPSKAIIQTENYINQIGSNGLAVRDCIDKKYDIRLHVVRPRGVILAGNSIELVDQKMKDDFRTLTQSFKNIAFITYDELLVRLENYIHVLESRSQIMSKKKPSKKKRT